MKKKISSAGIAVLIVAVIAFILVLNLCGKKENYLDVDVPCDSTYLTFACQTRPYYSSVDSCTDICQTYGNGTKAKCQAACAQSMNGVCDTCNPTSNTCLCPPPVLFACQMQQQGVQNCQSVCDGQVKAHSNCDIACNRASVPGGCAQVCSTKSPTDTRYVSCVTAAPTTPAPTTPCLIMDTGFMTPENQVTYCNWLHQQGGTDTQCNDSVSSCNPPYSSCNDSRFCTSRG